MFGIIWGLVNDVRPDGKLHWPLVFSISDYHSFNVYFIYIGIFNSLLGYCIQQLATRGAALVRTKAFRSGVPFVELLNDLPGSPYWKRYFRSNLTWKILVRVAFLYPAVSIVSGVLYKKSLSLSTFDRQTKTNYNYTLVTKCANDISNCPGNRYLKYGVAMEQARSGGAHSKGEETIKSGYRLTFVAAPTTAPLTSPQMNITSIHATSLAMVADYRNVTETLPKPRGFSNQTYVDKTVSLALHGTNDLDWSFSVQALGDAIGPYQEVQGMTRFCIVQSEWQTVNGTLSLQSYSLVETNCTQLDLRFWSDGANGLHSEIASSLVSDIVDEHWGITHPDALRSAYVVPAMYAVLMLGGWGAVQPETIFRKNNFTSWILLKPDMDVIQLDRILAIEVKSVFMISYLIIVLAIFIAHWVLGFFIKKTYVTEWAPLWFALLSEAELKTFRQQIQESGTFESKGLEEETERELKY